ncbi:type 1 glutamine amidotransferase domain-containing protein [Pseudomonas sp. N040]|uniref:type 1 glutamine amidotransferase domain-containing protein n=1 Tax=Pseudomonas sp. N040 TaxID=2785325 RepID=UPI0018A24B09|nr:type 1 glutamine amidotransferase domain-containing protein [Pseudomonas sp. N040]MBF7729928.1 thiJ/pfpI-family protein [Pseudomonas sp. N040]MBW7013570.1 type 1 glutamine amidotransferase domain-containing protein [Pseudomonas sp. N040]
MSVKTVLIPLPQADFDPTHVVVCWQVLRAAGLKVEFATVDGQPSAADPRMLDGEGLDLWGGLPLLRQFKLLGLLLRAERKVRRGYAQLLEDEAFLKPHEFSRLSISAFGGLMLSAGHRSRYMQDYLEDPVLLRFIADFFATERPVAAIAHGVLLAARSRRSDGRSVLYGRKTTAVPWGMERDAWNLTRFLGRIWEPDYYRVYAELPGEPEGYRGVEAEVTRALARPTDFLSVTHDVPDYFRKSTGLYRDSLKDSRPAWVVCDGNYISARWAGDTHTFATMLAERLHGA